MRRVAVAMFSMAIAASVASAPAEAQRGTNPRAAARREARAEAKAEAKNDKAAERQQQLLLAGQVRQRFAQVVKQRLNLTDDQARRLKDVNDRYEGQRDDVAKQERQARQNLRAALAEPNGGDQAKIDANMATITNAQRRRAEILESEQKDLGTFLTPKQRVQYFSLRDNLARRIQQMQENRAAGKPVPDPDQPQH
jgi:hypothetical protein